MSKSNITSSETSKATKKLEALEISPQSTKKRTVKTTFDSPTTLQWPMTMGRDEECQVITDTIIRVQEKPDGATVSEAEILHVHGGSGTGKSTAIHIAYDLALQKLNKNQESAGMAWVTGKYDEQQEGARPFSAILDAVTELYCMLEGSTISAIRRAFNEEELADLSAVIPLPLQLQATRSVGDGNFAESSESSDMSEHKNDSNQFKTFLRLFRRLLALICAHYNCVVLMLDDVQWMDDVSKALIAAVLGEQKITNFLFIACQRTGVEEPDFDLPETNFKVTTLEIAPIRSTQLNGMIASALTMSPSETEDFAEVVFRRTGGNTLFVVQFVELLCSKDLIKRKEDGKFEWDLEAIASKTQSTGNVADILVKKLSSLPFEIQLALIIAAHLGFRFKGKILLSLLENTELLNLFTMTENHSYSFERYVTTLYSGLEKAKTTGLVEQIMDTDEYRFTHDRIQKSARTLLPQGKVGDKILAKLGTLLLERIEVKDSEPWMVFAATKLLTKHASTDSIGKTRLAKLCLQAATCARVQSAYKQSAKYAETGCNKLGKNGWKKDYMLMLKLSCIAAEMYFAAGDFESSLCMVQKMEDNAICLEHCFRAYNVLIEILGAQGDNRGCAMESCKRLAGLGVKVPTTAGQATVLKTLIKTKLMLKGRSAKDLENLPLMTDEKKRQAVRMLGHVGESFWMLGDDDACACTCLIMLQTVLKYGICSEGVYAFTAYGVCLGHLGDIKESAAFFNLARDFAEKDDVALSITSATEHNMGAFLTKDLCRSPSELLRASKASASLGDIYRAGFSLKDVVPITVLAGSRLKELVERINYCIEFINDYEQNSVREHMSPWFQFAECISGRADDPTLLSGKHVQEEKILNLIRDINNLDTTHRVMALGWHYCQNFILLLHNMHEEIVEEQIKFKKVREEMGPNYQKVINSFNCALAHFSLAASKMSHRGKARTYANVVKKHSAAGSPSLKTMMVAIAAEEAVLAKKKDKAIEFYEQAAKEFGHQSMVLYKALTLERAARFALSIGDNPLGLRFFQEAFTEYDEYGAEAKTAALRKQYPDLNFRAPVPECVAMQAEDVDGDLSEVY